MTYTLDEAKLLAEDFIQQSEEIHDLDVSKYEQDTRFAYLLTQMEWLGIPLMMNSANEWAKSSEGNALLLRTYQRISKFRSF